MTRSRKNFGVIPIPGQTEADVVAFAGGETWTMHPQATKDQMDACWNILNLLSYDEEYLRELWQLETSWACSIPSPRPVRTWLRSSTPTRPTGPDH